ncbi:MAG: hypothetical protein R2774_01965 [Saprospiraceae bacterium]
MSDKIVLLIIIFFSISSHITFGQEKVNLYVNGIVSTPLQGFKSEQMFTGLGYGASGGAEYYVKNFGLGMYGGYFTNASNQSFTDFINKRYIETNPTVYTEDWKTAYFLLGPIARIGMKNLSIIGNIKGGYSQTSVPVLSFYKTFFSQEYEMYRFSGANNASWNWTWSAGLRLQYKLNRFLSIHTNADYLATSYLSKMEYETNFRDATDNNRNGVIEDAEYFESKKENTQGLTDMCALNFGLGLTYTLTKELPMKKPIFTEEVIPKKEDAEIVIEKEKKVYQPKLETDTPKTDEKHIPIVNLNEAEWIDAENNEKVVVDSEPKPEKTADTNFDAPEAQYDKEAAEFLYKAGESYFAANDFENAMPCFNKLKSDPAYPMAQYMFSLSLCALHNCSAAKTEYNMFMQSYKGEDKRTLEIIFASQVERCKGKERTSRLQNTISPQVTSSPSSMISVSQTTAPKTIGDMYKIQFIAIKKANAAFPNVESIGTIETEYFPNKSVYRYVLGNYTDKESAIADVNRIRQLGFRDAFIAVYHNDIRVNTIYHRNSRRK